MDGQIGGDANLSFQGQKYMNALPDLIKEIVGDNNLTVSFHSPITPANLMLTF